MQITIVIMVVSLLFGIVAMTSEMENKWEAVCLSIIALTISGIAFAYRLAGGA